MALLVIGGLALAACGGDDGGGDVSDEEQPYVDAIAAQFTGTEEGELTLTTEQAECVAPRWVDIITVERFEEQGVTPEDITDESEDELTTLGLDESQGNEIYDAFGECDVDITDLLVASFAEGAGPDADVECLTEQFDDDLTRALLVASLTKPEFSPEDDPELTGRLTEALAACGAVG